MNSERALVAIVRNWGFVMKLTRSYGGNSNDSYDVFSFAF